MNIKRRLYSSKYHQQGAATLLVTVVMLVLLTIGALTISNLTTTELKVSSNLNRAKEAFYAAQAGLDEASLHHLSDASASITNQSGVVSSGSYSYDLNSSGVITSRGYSEDGLGQATLHQTVSLSETMDYGTTVPVLSVGDVPTGGSFTIVANPNGGGDGVPVSAWSSTAGASGIASWQSCEYDEYISGLCNDQPDGRLLCEADESSCADFVTGDCPADPFETVFGEEVGSCSGGDWNYDYPEAIAKYRDAYSGLITCNDLSDSTKLASALETAKATGPRGLPALWLEEDCNVPEIGSVDEPIILVVEGDVTLNGNIEFGGILFGFTDIYQDDFDKDTSPRNDINVGGGAVINGGLATNGNLIKVTGSATIAYAPEILTSLTTTALESKGLVKQVGTWRDFE
ncbi:MULTISPECIES: PilX N-terminal domain-containing pilus assembly protein [unclassified Marinobacterium]|uniref:PilX N-terminal domain-containing pilus assembly protein n=1 Tax=unclassified Marinobacterium TaxID=2644139 RepID=UPI0015683D19|nr:MULTISPECIES: PilX N-terminal domain-containing pilus assembly protein [unclassified Marinobacterium]NRP26661.1 hypothetical protein [Marinobacterium sp. xm-d-420]NRP56508.1 hypothetical protein [Marinobacterium sp. xm-d-510]NRP96703.1 hypothetical protein [Marinobacterium sp. xm-a-127]